MLLLVCIVITAVSSAVSKTFVSHKFADGDSGEGSFVLSTGPIQVADKNTADRKVQSYYNTKFKVEPQVNYRPYRTYEPAQEPTYDENWANNYYDSQKLVQTVKKPAEVTENHQPKDYSIYRVRENLKTKPNGQKTQHLYFPKPLKQEKIKEQVIVYEQVPSEELQIDSNGKLVPPPPLRAGEINPYLDYGAVRTEFKKNLPGSNLLIAPQNPVQNCQQDAGNGEYYVNVDCILRSLGTGTGTGNPGAETPSQVVQQQDFQLSPIQENVRQAWLQPPQQNENPSVAHFTEQQPAVVHYSQHSESPALGYYVQQDQNSAVAYYSQQQQPELPQKESFAVAYLSQQPAVQTNDNSIAFYPQTQIYSQTVDNSANQFHISQKKSTETNEEQQGLQVDIGLGSWEEHLKSLGQPQ